MLSIKKEIFIDIRVMSVYPMTKANSSSAFVAQPALIAEELAGPILPVQLHERILSLDVLRGIAVMGILLSNIQVLGGVSVGIGTSLKPIFSGPYATLNTVLYFLQQVFYANKTRSLLEFIFGASAFLLLTRLEQRGGYRRAAAIFFRRYGWMAILGLCHSYFLWNGDFLFPYAVSALVFLYWASRFSNRTLIVFGLLLATIPSTIALLAYRHGYSDAIRGGRVVLATVERTTGITPGPSLIHAEAEWAQNLMPSAKTRAALDKAAKAGQSPYGARFHQPISAFTKQELFFAWTGSADIIGMMMLGIVLLRNGFLTGALPARIYVRTALAGLLTGIPIGLYCAWQIIRDHFAPEAVNCWYCFSNLTTRIPMVLGMTALLLLWIRSGRARFLSRVFSAVGQTALSNYLMTSVICQWIFAWGPRKLYGELEYFQLYLVVLGVWAFNLIFSTLWTRHFALGPIEWVWRSLSYWKLQPIRRGVPA
jgi:uncharacterized protein